MHNYTLIRKRIKKMYLRVKENEVIVIAPLKTSLKEINDFVYLHQDWIDKHIKEINYISSDDTIKVLDEEYTIIFSDKPRIDGNIIYTPNNEKVFNKLLLKHTKQYFYDRFYEIGQSLGITDYELKLKYYKSKWGSCTPSKRLITLNVNLIYTTLECIDAIIYHELAHTKVLNHSKDFYDVLLNWIPNYKVVIKHLKQVNIPKFKENH